MMERYRAKATVLAVVMVACVLAFAVVLQKQDRAGAQPLAAPTPGAGAMTVYSVTNPSATTINVQHAFTNTNGFSYSFWSQVAAGATATYHVSAIPQIPSPFNGTLTLSADQTFTAQIVGYDYPSGTATPTPAGAGGTATPTTTSTPTAVPPTSTPTASLASMTITSGASPSQVSAGQVVQQSITMQSNVTGTGLSLTQVVETLPAGFTYVPGSAAFQICSPCVSLPPQEPAVSTAGGQVTLTWTRADHLQGGQSQLLLTLSVTAGATAGTWGSTAAVTSNLGQTTAANVAMVTVAGGTPVTTQQFLLQSGQPAVVTATVANETIRLDVPTPPAGSTPISQVSIAPLGTSGGIVPAPPMNQLILALTIDAKDSGGNSVHQLAASMTLSVTYTPPAGVNGAVAAIYTLDPSGNTQRLPTHVTSGAGGTYTATAQVTHLSPFAVYGPRLGTPVPQAFVPIVP